MVAIAPYPAMLVMWAPIVTPSYPILPYLFRIGLVMVLVMASLTISRWKANLMVVIMRVSTR